MLPVRKRFRRSLRLSPWNFDILFENLEWFYCFSWKKTEPEGYGSTKKSFGSESGKLHMYRSDKAESDRMLLCVLYTVQCTRDYQKCSRQQRCIQYLVCRDANPHHFNADPNSDPAFFFNADPDPDFHFNADQDPAPRQCNANLRPLSSVYRPSRAPFWTWKPPL